MMKKLLIPALLLFLVATGCSPGGSTDGKTQVIDEFLSLKSDLYGVQDELIQTMDTMDLDDEAGEEASTEADGILSEIEAKFDEGAYDRLMANRMILDESLMSGRYDLSEIKNMAYEEISAEGDTAIYLVNYDEDLYYAVNSHDTIHHKLEFTLVDRDGIWKIGDIRTVE